VGEDVDQYIAMVDELSARADSPDQRLQLAVLKIKTYANSENLQKAVEVGESLLATEDLSETQRLEVYKILAEIYMYMVDDYEALSKYVDLILNSSAWVDDLDSGMGSDYYLGMLEIRKAGNED
jgi:two-component SAPR family response regulator